MERADYGYDAPYALVAFATVGGLSTVAAVVSSLNRRPLAAVMGLYSIFFLANAFSFLYTTRRGKFQVWRAVLGDLRLRGHERVLDIRFRRGPVLTAAAGRVRTGRARAVAICR